MNFVKTFFAALLAIVAANVLWFVLTILFILGVAVAFETSHGVVKPNSVLRIDFADGVTDEPDLALFSHRLEINTSHSLWQILKAIDHAAANPNIDAVYINISGGSISLANIEEVRSALERFREISGKRVIAYADTWSQAAYYLASVADRVYVHPEGGVAWYGLSSRVMFFKGLLDKLGIRVEVLRHGEFKSAVEPFTRESMSDESRLQMNRLLGSVWGAIREQVGASRGIDPQVLSDYARELSVGSSADAVRLGLADSVAYEDQVLDGLGEVVDLGDYISIVGMASGSAKIALVYIDGEIIDGESVAGAAGSTTISRRLAEVRDDKDVNGVVVRINSPGGSALAADVIWREMTLLREQKPVVVSMGALAASGGYYAACPADMILADRTTITGSIGVFGLIPDVSGALREKAGITTDVATSEPHADLGSVMRAMDVTERNYMHRSIEQIYDTFVGHVAAGRNMSTAAVDSLGGGRVWSGVDAVENGLADGIGGLADAITVCAERAGVSDSFRVVEQGDPVDALSMFVRSLSQARGGEGLLSDFGGLTNMLQKASVQARMPFELEIN